MNSSLTDHIALPTPTRNFCKKILKLKENFPHFSFYTSHTVPLKCKLPLLISFLARCVSFLSRRVSFLSRRVSFLSRRVSFRLRITEAFSLEYIIHVLLTSVHIKDGATILTCKHQQKVRSNVHCEILCVSIDCSIHVE